MKRYVVTVKENGDSFHTEPAKVLKDYHLKKIWKWIHQYEYSCLNQDEPWTPHFEIIEQEMEL